MPSPIAGEGKELWDEELSKHFEHYWYNARKKIDLRRLDGFGEIAVRIHDEGNTYLHLDRLFTLWQAVTTMPPAQAIVEIGAYQGGSAKFVAAALRYVGRPVPFYVCDTYEGHVVVDPELDLKHKVGLQFRTHRRTITEADLAAFANLSWLTEEIFTVEEQGRQRLVPGALVYAFAEGLLLPTMQDTGIAFLNATLDVKAPTVVGDTIHVECEVVEHRLASKGERGLVRFANKVVNQRGETVLEYNPLRLLKKT